VKPEKAPLDNIPLIALIGPTAVGKTGVVLELAERLGAEAVNLDSMQVYRHMDIGTAKPTAEERRLVRHHLLDLVNPDEEYNVNLFIDDAEKVCLEIGGRGRVPLLTGGTGLYLKGFQDGLFAMGTGKPEENNANPNGEKVRADLKRALIEQGRAALHERLAGIDPVSAARIHPNDTSRLLRALEVYALTGRPWSELLVRQQGIIDPPEPRKNILKIGLTGDRQWLYERINLRAAQMLAGGFIEEVKNLLAMGFDRNLKPMQAIGYRHIVEFLDGSRDQQETLELLTRDTRRYAKRQLTWFRRDPEIVWFRPEQLAEITTLVESYLADFARMVAP
jgi:tRNA dimethylallyltransferase